MQNEIAIRADERARIARELHDELGSALTTLKWNLEGLDEMLREAGGGESSPVIQEMEQILAFVDQTIRAMKTWIQDNHIQALDDRSFFKAIEQQANEFQARFGIVCDCEFKTNTVLTPEQSHALFRIVQESLTNVQRHSGATQVRISLDREGGSLVLRISDNGKGLPPAAQRQPDSGGLRGVRERARLLGGVAGFTKRRTGGTAVVVRIPVGDRSP